MAECRARLVAQRRHLPALCAQLRRRQRRRRRRSRRRALAARLPPRPRRRRHLVQPVVRLAARRRRLRRRRLPRHRAVVRHARRGRGADRRGARPSGSARSSTSSPTTCPTSTRGSSRPSTAGPGSPMRDRFWFRPGRGAGGDEPPNDWTSHFGDSAWTRTKNPDGSPGDWYLHLFAPAQPDLNWEHPAVRAEHEAILRFWFDRGAAGIRIDSAALAIKDPALPDLADCRRQPHPYRRPRRDPRPLPLVAGDRRRLRPAAGADRRGVAGGPPALRPLPAARRAPRRVQLRLPRLPVGRRRAARLHRRHPRQPRPGRRTAVVGAVQPRRHPRRDALRPRRHDVLVRRQAHRDADRPGPRRAPGPRRGSARRRPARHALRVPGRGARPARGRGPPRRALQDPMHFQSGGTDPGRDGCRVPLPWSGDAAVRVRARRHRRRGCPSRRLGDALGRRRGRRSGSMLALYRAVIDLRRERLVGGDERALARRGRTASSPSAAATSPASSTSSPAPVSGCRRAVLIARPTDERRPAGRPAATHPTRPTTNTSTDQ